MSRIGLLLLSLLWTLSVCARTSLPGNGTADSLPVLRPVVSAYTVEAGGSRLADTYLTPLIYNGWDVAFSYERMQAMKFSPEKWVMQLRAGLNFDRTHNRVGNASMWNINLHVDWGMMHRWRLPFGISLAAGGSTMLQGGCLYSTRNGNNPASARAAWTVNATGMAVWNFKIARLPIALRYQPVLPVAGVFFSPEYGQLYYEIYLGDRSGLVNGAWWGNYFGMENLVTADFRFGDTSLRIGYRGNILSTKVNNIVTRAVTNCFVIGVSGEWVSLSSRHAIDRQARIVSALY